MREISGKQITLRTMTLKEMKAMWRKYEPEKGKSYKYNDELVTELYERSVEREEWNPSLGIFTKNDEIMGELTFVRIVFSELRCELGLFLVSEKYRNKGYGTEAINLAKKYAKEVLGLKRIHADVSTKNKRAQHVFEKCGFNHIKTFKEDMPDGGNRMSYFALL